MHLLDCVQIDLGILFFFLYDIYCAMRLISVKGRAQFQGFYPFNVIFYNRHFIMISKNCKIIIVRLYNFPQNP